MSLAHRLKSRGRSLGVFEGMMVNDEKLGAKGFPLISPWWRSVLKGFYDSGKLRLVARVGRRGGKSSTMCRVAVAECLYGAHNVPPGDVGVFVIISVRKDEARERLRTIKEILLALDVPHVARGTEIRLKDKPIIFRVYPANFRSAVGMTCLGWIGDEMTRWRDESDSSNPATDVIASIKPAMATMRNAHEFYISSPWAKQDAHHTHFEMGNDEYQVVVHASTWEANPTLDIPRCKQLEQDPPTFSREYEAIPMENDSTQFFDEAAINAAMDPLLYLPRQIQLGEEVVAGADFAFVSDHSAIVICHNVDKRKIIGDINVLRPTANRPLIPSQVCARFATILARHGCKALMADGHYKESIVEHLHSKKIVFVKAPKQPAGPYIRTRVLLNQSLVSLPDDDDLKKRMLEVRAKPTPSGSISIQLPKQKGGGHADVVSALVLALFQRRGRVCTTPYNEGRPKGWTQAELDEVAEIEAKLTKNKYGIKPYITGL